MVFPYDLVKEDNLFFNGYINSMLNELDTVKVDDSTRLDSTRLLYRIRYENQYYSIKYLENDGLDAVVKKFSNILLFIVNIHLMLPNVLLSPL